MHSTKFRNRIVQFVYVHNRKIWRQQISLNFAAQLSLKTLYDTNCRNLNVGLINIWCIFAAILDMAVKCLREASVHYAYSILNGVSLFENIFPPEMQR